jgi:hypothetical protein
MTMTSLNKNNDGIDIESSQDVYIHNVDFATGDDCISIKSGRDLEGLQKMIPSKNIVVQNVRFLADDTIALGSEASGGVRNIFIENSEGTYLRKGFYFKANKNRGSHIRMRNLTYGDLADVPENRRKLTMIEVTTNYDSTGVEYNRDPEFKDIRLENFIGGTSINPLTLDGTDKIPLKDFVFDNVHLSAGEKPNTFNFVDLATMHFRNVTVDNSPLEAFVDGGQDSTIIPQSTNTPPDVYAGEENILSLSHGNSLTFSGDVIDAENDPMTFQWEAVPANAEAVSMGEDANGKNVNYPFGDASTVRFSNPTALATEVTFKKPGTYRLRLNVNDGQATGYHTVFTEVRQ